jgi:hypothetical protein
VNDGARSDVRSTIQELRAIRSTDPCAAIAMTTIKATIHTLETRWSPATTVRDDSGDAPV